MLLLHIVFYHLGEFCNGLALHPSQCLPTDSSHCCLNKHHFPAPSCSWAPKKSRIPSLKESPGFTTCIVSYQRFSFWQKEEIYIYKCLFLINCLFWEAYIKCCEGSPNNAKAGLGFSIPYVLGWEREGARRFCFILRKFWSLIQPLVVCYLASDFLNIKKIIWGTGLWSWVMH